MASTTQDELYQTFLAVSGQQTSAIGDTNAMLADVIAQLQEVRSSVPEAASASKTQTTTQATSTDSGSTVGSVVSTVLKSGFGLAPLISGLVSLFSGGDATTPPPLVKYALPAAVDFQAEESSGQVSSLNYDQTGMPRSYAEAAASGAASGDANGQSSGLTNDPMGIPRNYAETALSEGASPDVNGQSTGLTYEQMGIPRNYAETALSGGASADVNGQSSGQTGIPSSYTPAAGSVPATGAAPQITVNVQAMDARSFLDRSNDIAAAVRDAMLNMNSINDVVNEL